VTGSGHTKTIGDTGSAAGKHGGIEWTGGQAQEEEGENQDSPGARW
jgi:hypothetical protein